MLGPDCYYINAVPDANGYHGNPQTEPFPGAVKLSVPQYKLYLDSFGRVTLAVDDGAVVRLARNDEAYDLFVKSFPPPEYPIRPSFGPCRACEEYDEQLLKGVCKT